MTWNLGWLGEFCGFFFADCKDSEGKVIQGKDSCLFYECNDGKLATEGKPISRYIESLS